MARSNGGWNWLNLTAATMALCAGTSFTLAQPATDAKPADPAATTADASGKVERNAAGEPVNAETKRVYVVNLRGKLGHDVTATPMKAIMADIRKAQPDIVVFRVDLHFAAGAEGADIRRDPGAVGDLDSARQIATLFTDDLIQDTTWVKKPRIVMWIRRAMGGAAFLPFVAKDIFYTSDALHGGLGPLEGGWQGFEERVRQKMIGIFTKMAEGLAAQGEHNEWIVRAMMLYEFKLSVTYEGGKPVLHDDYSGEVLKEDPTENKDLLDTIQDVARGKGNDLLTLDAKRALDIGLSRGTADSLDQIMFELGFERNYVESEGRSKRILSGWTEDVRKAESQFFDLWDQYNNIQIAGATPQERNQKRGARIGVLNKIKTQLTKYKEAIDPRAIQGAPENWENEIDIRIEQLRQQIRVDK